ncbi:MAG: hypothetical protein J7L38_06270 [Thermoproteales archaeon]|nr:hypothetical protein [Thermoproteales archaeon]
MIILDACRYDFFKEHYMRYFDGELIKTYSVATNTPEWVEKIFDTYKEDVIYISANPFINSRTCEGKLFYRVIDAWSKEWNESLRCVPPWGMNRVVIEILMKYPDKRIIAHYMQPHAPYLVLPVPTSFLDALKHIRHWKNKLKFTINRGKALLAWKYVKILNKLGIKNAAIKFVKVRDFLIDYTLALVGEKGLREAYRANLELALSYVTLLVKNLEQKHLLDKRDNVIITSDHGEVLGEYGDYGHWPPKRERYKELIEVPWFIVNKYKGVHPFNPYDRDLYRIIKLKYMLRHAS